MDSLATLWTQYNRPLSTAIKLALVVLMAISLANGVLFFIENMGRSEVTNNRQAAPAPAAKALDTSQIRDLFGKYQDAAAPQSFDAPKTTLNLELQGIFTAENAADSSAIVAQRGKSGELYRIGDRLPGNATLEAVHDDHILIKRGARTEKLPFSDNAISAGFSQIPSTTPVNINIPQSNVATGTTRLEQVRERIARRSQELAQKRNALPRQSAPDLRSAIDNFQKRLDENPAELLTELDVDVVETEKGSGYRIGGEVSQTMLRQAGLRQGDVVLSVNGRPASSVANDKNLMDQVMQSERVRVEVQRNDRRFYVTVPIPQ